LKRSQGLVENPRPTLRFSTSLVMSFTTVLDFRVLNFCSEDGGVKEGGRGVEGGLAGRVVLAVGLVLAGGVVLEKVVVSGFRARCVLIAASWCADWNLERASS
jgi:hypothetical protein